MNNNEMHQRYLECLNEIRLRRQDDVFLAKIALEREVLETAYEPLEREDWTYRDSVLHAAQIQRAVEIERECQQKHGISKRSFEAELHRDLARGLFPVACYRRLGERRTQAKLGNRSNGRLVHHG